LETFTAIPDVIEHLNISAVEIVRVVLLRCYVCVNGT